MKTLIAILVLSSACPALVDSGVTDGLKKQYEKQILVLRTPFQKGDQEFDSVGRPLKDLPADQWRVYGPLLITSIKSEPNRLRLEGVRVISSKNLKPAKEMLLQSGKTIKVAIHLDHPLSSADDAQAILDRVFFLNPARATYPQPEYRRPDENLGADQKIYHVGNNVLSPQPLYQPDPDYSVKAREAKYQGTLVLLVVVDTTGRVSRIKFARTLGLGLDEKAVEKVETWKFKPATRDGQPVAVEVNVEVSFQLW